jgi:uncharacterized protein (DUF302 family)
MNTYFKTIGLHALLAVSLLGTLHAKTAALFYDVDANRTAQIEEMIEKGIKEIGFIVTDPSKNIQDPYTKKYGSSVFAKLDFFPITHEGKLQTLLEKEPRLAGFNPFNVLMYQRKGDKQIHVGHLSAEAILEMLNIQQPEVKKRYIAIINTLDGYLSKHLKTEARTTSYTVLPDNKMMEFEVTLERNNKDLDDVLETFQEDFEAAFEKHHYIIAGFENYKEAYEDAPGHFAAFDAFWTYSLCHFTYSYSVFDHKNGRPDAGIFAPCTMYMYVKKGTNKLVIGMPRLANWHALLGIKDPKKVDFMKKLDTEIPSILQTDLHAKSLTQEKKK